MISPWLTTEAASRRMSHGTCRSTHGAHRVDTRSVFEHAKAGSLRSRRFLYFCCY
jgi:hypothetical protein